jgi:CBS domain-containing protein
MTVGIYKKTVKEVMTTHVATIRTQETVHDALQLMAVNRLSALPVVDQVGNCVGVVSQSDLIALASEADSEERSTTSGGSLTDLIFGRVPLDEITNERIVDVMSTEVVAASPDELLTTVTDKLLKYEVHHIPVCNDEKLLVGIVSTLDILRALRDSVAS